MWYVRGLTHAEVQLKNKDPAMLIQEEGQAEKDAAKAKKLAKYLAINAHMGLDKYVEATTNTAFAAGKAAKPKQSATATAATKAPASGEQTAEEKALEKRWVWIRYR
jgi:hypothetical protein